MAQKKAAQAQPTAVTIGGRTYNLRGHRDPEYLQELAAHVDSRIREIAEITGTADSLKVAILACLNISDDYFKSRDGGATSRDVDSDRRVARMIDLLDETLAG